MRRPFAPLVLLALVTACARGTRPNGTEWPAVGGDKAATHYSTLAQIDTTNVSRLQVAWTYQAEPGEGGEMQANPIMVDGLLYVVSPKWKVAALDPATGVQRWQFDPADSAQNPAHPFTEGDRLRGVTYWADGADRRILYGVGSTLFAIDARSGRLVQNFGTRGGVDLRQGLGRDIGDLYYQMTTPGVIYRDLYIVGSRVGEQTPAAPGHIRAFDVRSGAQRWIFHTIPEPGEVGYDSWDDSTAYHFAGGANAWAGLSVDEARGLVFAPTGAAPPDLYGGQRLGNNLFANSLIALDAATGRRRWHFQFVHHDLWDYDLPSTPLLATITRDGRQVDAVVEQTKNGFVFVFERETGKPLFPIEERPVSQETDAPGERLSPTQPMPVLPRPFARQTFTEADLNDLVADSAYQELKRRFRTLRAGPMFLPPGRQWTVTFPGLEGGAEWGGPAFDPETGLLYVNSGDIPWLTQVLENPEVPRSATTFEAAGKQLYSVHCGNCHGQDLQGGPDNRPSLIGVERKVTAVQFQQLLQVGRKMMPAFRRLTQQDREAIATYVLGIHGDRGRRYTPAPPSFDAPLYSFNYQPFETIDGHPAVKPPWGTLHAIDLNTGEYKWEVPLGDDPAFKGRWPTATGTSNRGGAAVTAGGLVFIGATFDKKFRAFNKRTGQVLWEVDLPANGKATPSVYEFNGKQFVVIGAGEASRYLAFALPDGVAKR